MTGRQRLVCAIAAILLLVEVFVLDSRGVFLLAAAGTTLGGFAALYIWRRNDGLASLIYGAGVIGAVAAYCYLALAPSKVAQAGDEVIYWGILDKRPMIFGYLGAIAFVAFHWCVAAFAEPRPAIVARTGAVRGWTGRVLGGLFILVLAWCWLAVPAFQKVVAVGPGGLAWFYDIHAHVHLASMEQIRLGAIPYLEAQTQYGAGNQVLMNFLTGLVHYSNHGFFAANVALNVACVLLFFLVLQQVLGLGWAIAGLIGWALWPSPAGVADVAGWAVFTRWLAIPILSLSLAWLLLAAAPATRGRLGPLLTGALWGLGGFLSQESFTGGFLVLALSLTLLGPATGWSIARLAAFAGLYVGSGIVVFVALVAGFVGLEHLLDVLALADAKSSLVMAGLSNSIWSDALGLSLAFKVVHGRLYTEFTGYGELHELAVTYLGAGVLVLGIALLGAFLGRRWSTAGETERRLAWKFGGVAIGAAVLHLFTLLRADLSHLSGPSFLLPLFLLMLPVFVWRCVPRGMLRTVLLVGSIGIVAEAAIVAHAGFAKRVQALSDSWNQSIAAREVYRELRSHRGQPPDLVSRYSPIPRFQAGFRNHPDFPEVLEMFGLLHDRLKGRRVEQGFHKFDELIGQPDSFYFFGGFRSVSGITSPMTSIWMRSDEDAWIARVIAAPEACVFFQPDPKGRLFDTFMKSGTPGALEVELITGRQRVYGVLACKAKS